MSNRGHNNPPEMLELAREVTQNISSWFAENPAVTNEKEAKEIKLHIDRAKLCMRDLEDERDRKVRPLNEQVKTINASYKGTQKPLDAVRNTMLEALDSYIRLEEQHRLQQALEARRKAAELEEAAREADRLAKEAIENVKAGEVGIDIAEVSARADEHFMAYAKAARAAIRADEERGVKIAGGLGKAIGLREREVLEIDDAVAAIKEIGVTDGIKQAILTSARAFRRLHERLPSGISATIERRAQ